MNNPCPGHTDGQHREDWDGSCMGAGCDHRFRDVPSATKTPVGDDLATPGDPFVLAVQVLQNLGGGPHTVTSQLDRDRPETIRGWTFLQDALRIAYNQGVSDSTPAAPGNLTHGQTPVPEDPRDVDGENQAVRMFLLLYDQRGLTVARMREHMESAGWPQVPEWATKPEAQGHLTKAGAQSWLRHLFALETPYVVMPPLSEADEAKLLDALKNSQPMGIEPLPAIDLRPHLAWALKRISTSLGEGEHFAAAQQALDAAQQITTE